MPLSRLSSTRAYANLDHRPEPGTQAWPIFPPGEDENNIRQDRLTPIAYPLLQPSFRVSPDTRVFTIGSCFARNIEQALVELGFDVPSARAGICIGSVHRSAAASKFNPYAILSELTWALDPDSPFPDPDGFIPSGDGKVFDPHLHLGFVDAAFCDLEEARLRRRQTREVFAEIRTCGLIVITLGLAEVWFDKHLEQHLNGTPPRQAVAEFPERFELHVLTESDIVTALEQTHALLTRHVQPGFRVLLSVSPVPLAATFTDQDVLVANAYSKAVQRSAAEVFCRRHDDVDYIPSYEAVTLSNPRYAMQHDLRHVTSDLVDTIMHRVIDAYVEGRRPLPYEAYHAEHFGHAPLESQNPRDRQIQEMRERIIRLEREVQQLRSDSVESRLGNAYTGR